MILHANTSYCIQCNCGGTISQECKALKFDEFKVDNCSTRVYSNLTVTGLWMELSQKCSAKFLPTSYILAVVIVLGFWSVHVSS